MRKIICILLLACAVLGFSSGKVLAVDYGFSLNEDFSNGFNQDVFYSYQTSAAAIDTSGQNFRVSIAATPRGSAHHGRLISKCSLRGDFDITIDYNAILLPVPSYFAANTIELSITDGIHWINLTRMASVSFRNVYALCIDSCSVRFERIGTSDMFGKLRLVRTGSMVQAYFASGVSPAFQELGLPYQLGANDVKVEAFILANLTGSAVEGSFDNYVINAGSALCPVVNQPPFANAGSDQTVNELSLVSLDGSASSDPEGNAVSFEWTQLAGPSVSLDLTDPSRPTFLAPAVLHTGETLAFQLVVNDGKLSSAPDIVNINVKNVNHAPTADAGLDRTVVENTSVALDGSSSYDPDGDALMYSWVQTAGPKVLLSDTGSMQPAFTAPVVGSAGATLTFQLTVTDGIDSAADTVNVIVENVNHAPIANAGTDQTRSEGNTVTLDGTISSDPDGDPITYTWSQIAGPAVILSDMSSPVPTFSAPMVGHEGTVLVFQLVVNDGLCDSQPAQVTINILDVDAPPACEKATAVPSVLWPPNHKLMPVSIVGVDDPDNDQVKINVTGVTQDEPVNGLGDGDTSPDAAKIEGNKLFLRAERSGINNGRTYHVSFSAEDGFGQSCTGTVSVTVPHDRGGEGIDDGALYNSLLP